MSDEQPAIKYPILGGFCLGAAFMCIVYIALNVILIVIS